MLCQLCNCCEYQRSQAFPILFHHRNLCIFPTMRFLQNILWNWKSFLCFCNESTFWYSASQSWTVKTRKSLSIFQSIKLYCHVWTLYYCIHNWQRRDWTSLPWYRCTYLFPVLQLDPVRNHLPNLQNVENLSSQFQSFLCCIKDCTVRPAVDIIHYRNLYEILPPTPIRTPTW